MSPATQSRGLRALLASALTASAAAHMHNSSPTGPDILNFALNLECLEATFYSYAAFGKGLSDELRGGGPEAIGGEKAELTQPIQEIAAEIARDEMAHVAFLRAALGDAAVPCPLIDIGPAFEAAVNAAAGADVSPPFSVYSGDVPFLYAAFIFEDVGVTAFRGAVEPLSTLVDGATLSVAAGILGTEAYHAGAIRATLLNLATEGTESALGPIDDVVGLISDLRDSVDGDDDLDEGIVDADGAANIVPTDENALVQQRTVAQALAIVYLGGERMGGFFPEGVNGFFGPEQSRDHANVDADDDDDTSMAATGMYGDSA